MQVVSTYLVRSSTGLCELYMLINGVWILNSPHKSGGGWTGAPERVDHKTAIKMIDESRHVFEPLGFDALEKNP